MDQLEIINLEGVEVFQRQHLVLTSVDLKVNKGEFIFLIGQTGSGKSSLLKMIYGDLLITKGQANVVGFDLNKIKCISLI
jgi:cell division transport system ATP-binding protein